MQFPVGLKDPGWGRAPFTNTSCSKVHIHTIKKKVCPRLSDVTTTTTASSVAVFALIDLLCAHGLKWLDVGVWLTFVPARTPRINPINCCFSAKGKYSGYATCRPYSTINTQVALQLSRRDSKALENTNNCTHSGNIKAITHHLPGCYQLTKIERTLSRWVPPPVRSRDVVMTDSWEACWREDASATLCCRPFSRKK